MFRLHVTEATVNRTLSLVGTHALMHLVLVGIARQSSREAASPYAPVGTVNQCSHCSMAFGQTPAISGLFFSDVLRRCGGA